jgi:putative DNA primase/helicase
MCWVLITGQRKPTRRQRAREGQLEADRQQREQERQKQAAEDAEQRRATFARLYAGMRQRVTQGESEYLQSKGLTGFNYPLMPDGSLLLELVDESGAVAAAQTITRREKSDF